MVKFIKKFVFITIHLIINFLFFTYRIIHKFFVKNKTKIKETLLNIDEVLKKVCLIYENKNALIQYQMEIQSENKSYAYDIEDKKVKRTQITVDGNKIDIIQYELEDGNEENVAQFAYEDVFYTINATMKEADFKELLNNLYFF